MAVSAQYDDDPAARRRDVGDLFILVAWCVCGIFCLAYSLVYGTTILLGYALR